MCIRDRVQAFSIYDSASFSWKHDINYFNTKYLPITSQLKIFSLFLITLNAWTSDHYLDKFSLLRPSLPIKNGIGILTYCPSTTSFDLALGPDSPPADEPSGGNLRFSGHWILTNVFATQADILTSCLLYTSPSPRD